MDDLYRTTADPTRRAILYELVERDGQSLFELCSSLAMKHGIGSSRQGISQHLEVLESAGLAKPFKSALVEDGIPFAPFDVQNIAAENERLESLGVQFTQPSVDYRTVITVVLGDTCGNLIQIAQEKGES